jgi:hypothetical protein
VRVALTASPLTTTLCCGNSVSPPKPSPPPPKDHWTTERRDHPTTQNSHLVALSAAGVSVWLDDLSRDRLPTGNLRELIDATNFVFTTSLYERFQSRRLGEFTDKILSAMRREFGGHAEKSAT